MTTTQQTEFLQQHAQDGVMTPEQAAQFLELAEGDTGTKLPETGSVPSATTAEAAASTDQAAELEPSKDEPGAATTPAASEPDPANAVILAKDGKHTIPYSKLEEARQAEQAARAAAKAAQDELAALRAQADQRAAAGIAPTAADNASALVVQALESGEVDPAIFGDFSEAAMAKGIATLIKQGFTELRQEIAPLKQQQEVSAIEKHYAAIYEAHPDADSVAESQELDSWINSKPSFVRDAYRAVLDPDGKGTAAQVIELFDTFKKETGATQAAAAPAPSVDPKAAAKAAIAAVQPAVPASLSDFPGGRAGASSRMEALDALSPADLVEALESMPQAQRDLYLSRQM
jgi:hypothetical protein